MIPFPALLSLSLPEHPSLAEGLQFQLTGLLVVLLTLGSLALLVGFIGRIFTALDGRRVEPPPTVPAPDRKAAPARAQEEIPAPVLAAIAGAVAAVLGDSRFAIRGVQVADPRQNLAWSAEGRRSIYASRNVR
jgi:Na+-transporting methylmalonyl-CoA/oxaloacetate decarboxylase gamma subunit